MKVKIRKQTVDTLKCGNPKAAVKGVVTTFMATQEVLKKAKTLKANFVITHEPLFYNHLDETLWLKGDPVYRAKARFLRDSELAVWRLHDTYHDKKPDGITEGMMEELGWKDYQEKPGSRFLKFPSWKAQRIADMAKKALKLRVVRIAGDPEMKCRRVATLFGACGGKRQMADLRRNDVDVLICGESPEWETCEYVRDACAQGRPKTMIVLGHAPSEEAGMEHFAKWLAPRISGIPVRFVPAGNPFRWV
jgi:putative NIF3 family GTP cyclohydrolase 1 type 2